MKCFLCNSQKIKPYIEKDNFLYFKCRKCNLIQQRPLPDKNIIQKIYDGNEIYFIDKKKGTTLKSAIKIRSKEVFYYSLMSPYLKEDMKILDFGAATGLMLALLKSKGFSHIEGIELSKWACSIAKTHFNLDIKNMDINEVNFPEEYFNFVISSHIIEHLHDPISIFKKINKILNIGGFLFLSTPNSSCFNAKLVRKYWRYYIPNEHLFLFNKKSIKYLLKKVGFEVIEIKNYLYGKGSFLLYTKQLILPIVGSFYRKIFKKQSPSNSFFTFKDGMIILAKKVKKI